MSWLSSPIFVATARYWLLSMRNTRQAGLPWLKWSGSSSTKQKGAGYILQAVSHFQRHSGKGSPFFHPTSVRIIVSATDSTKVKRHLGTFQNYVGCPREFRHSLFKKWGEPLWHKIDFEWEHHIELKYNRCLNFALGRELIESEWDNNFLIQKCLTERNTKRNFTCYTK